MSRDPAGVSVIILNFNGRSHLETCLASLSDVHYPRHRLEVLLVDNGSRDGSVEWVRSRFPSVRLLALGENLGYARAMNRGVTAASHEVLAFLNNDTRQDPGWLEPLVDAVASGESDAASAKLFDIDGKTVHFAGGGANFHGIAFQRGMGDPDSDAYSKRRPTLFACGAAMAIRRDVFREAGGFDEDFFAYYEDVDLGWRLWVLGRRILLIPESRVYHHHSATSLRIPIHKLRVLHLRNPLFMVAKNYDDESFRRVWPAALLLSIQRGLYLAHLSPEGFRIGSAPDGALDSSKIRALFGQSAEPRGDEPVPLPRVAASDWIAYGDLLAGFPALIDKRRRIQVSRRRPDAEILPLFVDPFWAVEQHPGYLQLQRTVESCFGIDALFPGHEKRDRGPSY
ncbi:MAG: glycosyltransferase family 2 protein [Planctomycetes bacterium]|nr:glycosyltransferase family 2 protein [Planctomycetota bacterium]MBI3848547.1 glycosyltransferase family 2 protein [Planctomycetota bacterium]